MIFLYTDDAKWLKSGIPIPINIIKNIVIQEPFSKTPPKEFDITKYNVYTGNPTKLLVDNDIIDIGSRVNKGVAYSRTLTRTFMSFRRR